MVKSDVRKDYYADLGLQPSAEAEDVKRQFRKLGELEMGSRLNVEGNRLPMRKLSSTTQTETPEEKSSSTPNSRPSKPPTKY